MSSTENTVAKKRKSTSDSTPVPDTDHRKRRRNRTTQSCLNCHTSKRMCDRKRPACARCTQLGLTGLCVYEIDDPSQQIESQDESSRLLKRVAELEGVIRELKNKPHPRWVQSPESLEEFNRWHTHSKSCSSTSSMPSPEAIPVSESLADCSSSGDSGASILLASPSIHLGQPTVDSRRATSPLSPSSPMSGSSPGILTPTDDYPYSPVVISAQSAIPDYHPTSMSFSFPGIMPTGDNLFASLSENRLSKQTGGSHCGCVHDPATYNTMLELSLRLRKASNILGRAPNHQLGDFCQLHQRIAELDLFAINALSDGCAGHLSDHMHGHPNDGASVHGTFRNSQVYRSAQSSIAMPRHPSQGTPQWNLWPSACNSPLPADDSFMTWEPPRQA